MSQIVEKKRQEIISRSCRFEEQTKGTKDEYNIYREHIQYVYKYAVMLSEDKNVDGEVVELAALLHDISMTDNGIAEVPEIEYHAETNTSASDSIVKSDSPQQELAKRNIEPVLIAVICVSVIGNIIMLLITLHYRSKWKALKTEQSERTDFEIEIWE